MLPGFCRDEVTIVTASRNGPRNERDWTNATRRTVSGCSFQPSNTTGEVVDRESASETYRCYMPPQTQVDQADRLEYDGVQYLIIGFPRLNRSPLGAVSNLEIVCERWHG